MPTSQQAQVQVLPIMNTTTAIILLGEQLSLGMLLIILMLLVKHRQ